MCLMVAIYPLLPSVTLSLLKYARFMMNYSIDGARDVYTKACLTHLPKKPSIHFLWAMFEEQQGKLNCCLLLVVVQKLV